MFKMFSPIFFVLGQHTYMILYVSRRIVMYLQCGLKDHLGWPPLLS